MFVERGEYRFENISPRETKQHEQRLMQFLRQKFPLSEEGKNFFEKIKRAFENKDVQSLQDFASQVPTVENPRPELFAELSLSPAQEEEFLGRELANIQITKGCSHGCSFCAISADNGVEAMPFPAIVKLASVETEYDIEAKTDFDNWVEAVQQDTGIDVMEFQKFDVSLRGRVNSEQMRKILDLYKKHLNKYLPSTHFVNESMILSGGAASYIEIPNILQFLVNKTFFYHAITNYYDSDPFDYRDVFFPHEDGTPADFGDVCKVLASKGRPIHITTAGWRQNNKVAQRAAYKIVELYKQNPSVLSLPRISINPTHKLAQKDLVEYVAMMKNVIFSLRDIHPMILVFEETNKESEYQKVVIEEIERFIKEEIDPLFNKQRLEIRKQAVSNFSGRARDYEDALVDNDVMACMPGYHILPDGTVLKQGSSPKKSYFYGSVEKGSRPQKVEGVKAFTV